jgi:hypothetical protein
MATFVFFDEWKATQADAAVVSTDVFKAYLSNDAPVVGTDTVKANVAEITAAGGYAEKTLTTAWAETGAGAGIWRLSMGADQTWTASGAAFDAFQYVVVYDSTVAGSPLVGYWNYGSALTLNDGDSFTLDVDANFSVYTLT